MIHSLVYTEEKQLLKNLPMDKIWASLQNPKHFVWVDFDKPEEIETELLVTFFKFHPLAIEDCVQVSHYPKVDNFEEYLFLVTHAPKLTQTGERVKTTELNTFIGKNYLVTYHVESVDSVFSVMEKCELNPSQYIGKGGDFLFYHILHLMAENYLPILDTLDDKIAKLEAKIFIDPNKKILANIFTLKKDILYLRRVIGPQRDTINLLSREPFPHISQKARIYFRDVYDSLFRVYLITETYRDLVTGSLEIYLSAVTERTNTIMKTLTLFASIILPLTFITGIYGMNFDWMPFLHSPNGFWYPVGMMGVIGVALFFFFRRKKWM